MSPGGGTASGGTRGGGKGGRAPGAPGIGGGNRVPGGRPIGGGTIGRTGFGPIFPALNAAAERKRAVVTIGETNCKALTY